LLGTIFDVNPQRFEGRKIEFAFLEGAGLPDLADSGIVRLVGMNVKCFFGQNFYAAVAALKRT
jgi:hypothetical protein